MSFVDEKLKEWSKSKTSTRIIDLFNPDGSEENVNFLQNVFKKSIAEIRLTEGIIIHHIYVEKQTDTKGVSE